MKLTSILALTLLGAACHGGYKEEAASNPAPAASAAAMTTPAPAEGPSFVALVVTTDASAPSLTLRETAGLPADPSLKTSTPELRTGDRTIRVEGPATAAMTTVKAGDQVRVSCRELSATADTAGAPAATAASTTVLGRCESIVAVSVVVGAATGR